MKLKYKYISYLFLSTIIFSSCKKYLDAKPDKSLVIPTSTQDLQGILDTWRSMNASCSEASEIATDNYYLTDAAYQNLQKDRMRYAYLWKPEIFLGLSPSDWVNEYDIVYNANIVLDQLSNIERNTNNSLAWDNCKGSALVFRGKSFFEIAQIWGQAYDSSTSETGMGIPLRLTSDFNVKSVRSSIKETYAQIIQDLQMSISLLPNIPVFPYRPSKPAAYGLLARTYLAMRNYVQAKLYADSCLQINGSLLDYNDISEGAFSFTNIKFSNPEDIMHSACTFTNYDLIYLFGSRIDSLLYKSYDVNDLRKTIYFKIMADSSAYFIGSYDGALSNYNGIATDEMYITRAECLARQGNIADAMNDLNKVLSKRWKTGTFTPLIAPDAATALNIILIERRKELLYRMLRFTDLKRLNKEGANISIKRIINGTTYILPPNDPRYALPIPDNVIQTSGIIQN